MQGNEEHKYDYLTYDGRQWRSIVPDNLPMPVPRLPHGWIMQAARNEVFGYGSGAYEYHGISQIIEVWETETGADGGEIARRQFGLILVPGRLYHCPSCGRTFPHPAQELATCRCGLVVPEPEPKESQRPIYHAIAISRTAVAESMAHRIYQKMAHPNQIESPIGITITGDVGSGDGVAWYIASLAETLEAGPDLDNPILRALYEIEGMERKERVAYLLTNHKLWEALEERAPASLREVILRVG